MSIHDFQPASPNGKAQPELSPSGDASAAGDGGRRFQVQLPPTLLTIIVLSCASGITATTCGILIGRGGDFLLVAAFAIASVMLASKAFSIAAVYERTFHHIIDRADEYLAVADRACRDLQKVSGAYWRMVDDQTHQTGQKPGDGGVVVPFKR